MTTTKTTKNRAPWDPHENPVRTAYVAGLERILREIIRESQNYDGEGYDKIERMARRAFDK